MIEKGKYITVKGETVLVLDVQPIATKDLIEKTKHFRVTYRTPAGEVRHFNFKDERKTV